VAHDVLILRESKATTELLMITRLSDYEEAPVTTRNHILRPSLILAAIWRFKHLGWLSAGLALLLSAAGAEGQGSFQNLDFESANLAGYSPTPPGGPATSVPISDGLPNWSAYFSSVSGGTFQLDGVWYDAQSLGGAAISVVDNKSSLRPPIQGNYDVLLSGGGGFNDTSTTISQTGLVPSDTMSLQVTMQWSHIAPVITLGGLTVNMVPLQTFANYTLYGGDISSFAGLVETLSFTEPPPPSGMTPPSFLYLDDIVFSPQVVPEPSIFALFALGAIFISGLSHRRQR
jgi:hypothetical protein